MAATKEGMDDMIVHLMSMGFEIQECQDAINFGKNTVESAVEWLISGKPGFNPSTAAGGAPGPSLRLRPAGSEFETGQFPYQKPNPIPAEASASSPSPSQSQSQTSKPADQSESSSGEMDQSEAPVVSRLHLSDNQRKQKDGFEQKKRDEARKQAMLEKRRQKEEHARVLKEIAEDRESKKMFKPSSATSPEDQTSAETGLSQAKQEKKETAEAASKSSSATCLLQIRLPDGKSVRHSFSATSLLQEVWDFTAGHHKDMTGLTFIQPFPHHEYTAGEMAQSLSDLELTPRSSLVLQKRQISQAVDEATESAEMVVDDTSTAAPPAPPSAVRPPNISHIWGQGQAMDAEHEQGIDIAGPGAEFGGQDIEELPSDEEEGDPEMVIPGFPGGQVPPGFPGGQVPPGFGQGPPGFAHGGFGGRGGHGGFGRGGHGMPAMGRGHDPFAGMGVPGGHQQHAFGGVGQRLVAVGEPGQEDLALQQKARPARDLAFERAQARMAQPADNAPEPSTSQPHLHSPSTVTSLMLHCLKHIAHRLNDPRHQILSLAGVSEDMAQVVLQHLIKEKQLKPQTLKAFVPCYLRKLVLDCYPYTTNELLHSIRLHTNLSSLSLSSCPLITDQGLHHLNSLKKLKKLNLSCCKQISNKSAEVFSNLQSLVSLNLEDTGVTDAGVMQYLASKPSYLQHLNLNRTSVTQVILPHLCNHAKQLRTLAVEDTKVVSLSGVQVVSLSGVQDIEHLESLNVARTGIVPESLLCIASCARLKSLNIANTENLNGDEALRHIQNLQLHNLTLPSRHTTTNIGIQYLTGFPLVALDLTNYIFVGDEAMEHIGKLHSLKRLLLSNTKLTETGMMFLEGLKQLEELSIDRTLVTDEGAAVIGALTNLIELSMASTGVTTRFLLTGSLNSCTNLIKLNLSKTLVTSKGVKKLTLPFLQLLSLDGTKVTPDLTVSMVTGCPNLTQMSARNLQVFTRDDEVEEADMVI